MKGSRALPSAIPKQHVLKRPNRPAWMSPEEYATMPRTIEVRIVTSTHPKCRDKYLITSLLDSNRYPDAHILAEFAARWDVELDLRNLKDTLGAGVLGCQTPDMIIKELAIYVLGYTLIRLLMCEAAVQAGLEPRQISFRHTQQCWSAWVMIGAPLDETGWQILLTRIAGKTVRCRPGRVEPWAVKRRPKRHKWLDLPRADARLIRHAYERSGR